VRDIVLDAFSVGRPAYIVDQNRSLEWLAEAHTWSEATRAGLSADGRREFGQMMRRRLARFGCDASKIGSRGGSVADVASEDWDSMTLYDVRRNPRGRGTTARMAVFARVVDDYFAAEYAGVDMPPGDLVHVTCTGYVAPSAAQELVAKRGWGAQTRVVHAYHMGCNAAFPAVRIASGLLDGASDVDARVDVVHTEVASIHLDPSDHSAEQLVVQSLFADGFVRYAVRATADPDAPGLHILAVDEAILPDSESAMRWVIGDQGMHMTLSRDVPARIGTALRGFVVGLYARAGLDAIAALPGTIFAVHPGGPRIIDQVAEGLELEPGQVAASRQVLHEHGNMSSATLPHVWQRLQGDRSVASGTLIASLAFGPGLTICGGLFRKA